MADPSSMPDNLPDQEANPVTLTIRPADVHDVPAMAAIRAHEWETQAYWEKRIGNYLWGEIGAQHSLLGHAVFVAVRHDTVLGFIAGHRTRRFGCDGELEWIDVVEAHRRQGIAGKLIVTLAAWFVQQQALRICIDVKPQNTAARGLYAKYGAKPLNPHWMIWEDIRAVLHAAQRADD
jgi:ribosomal protein S18 acetylase RimI-like enzyme